MGLCIFQSPGVWNIPTAGSGVVLPAVFTEHLLYQPCSSSSMKFSSSQGEEADQKQVNHVVRQVVSGRFSGER